MKPTAESKLFHQEIREKKRTGRGIHSAKGKRGYVGKLYLQYDLLKGKEKRAYAKAGEVKVTNLFDRVLTRAEFEALPQEERTKRLKHWREKYKVKEIQQQMGIASATFYKFVEEAGLAKQRLARGKHAKKKTSTTSAPVAITPAQELTPATSQEPAQNGLNVSLKGEYTVEELQSKLERLNLVIEGEKAQFQVNINLIELKN